MVKKISFIGKLIPRIKDGLKDKRKNLSWEQKYYMARAWGSFEAFTKYLALICCCWLMYLIVFAYDNTAYSTLNPLLILSGVFGGFMLMEFSDSIVFTLKIKRVKK